MINFLEKPQAVSSQIDGVVQGAGGIEQDHTCHKDCHRDDAGSCRDERSLDQHRNCSKNSEHHADKMSDGAARFTDCDCHRKHLLESQSGYSQSASLLG